MKIYYAKIAIKKHRKDKFYENRRQSAKQT